MKTQKIYPLYQIIFEDDTEFTGGNYLETKWTDIPYKKIKRIYYRLPSGDYLCLGGYEQYYHMIEGLKILTGENKGQLFIKNVHLFGKRKNIITRFSIVIQDNNKAKMGSILRTDFDINDNFFKGINPNGWR